MSIPGLGQIPVQAPKSTTRTVTLPFRSEWRFVVSQPPVKVRLLSGMAERDGTELALNKTYTFAGTQSKLYTYHGCEIEVDGVCDSDSVVTSPPPTTYETISLMDTLLNLHTLLAGERDAIASHADMANGAAAASFSSTRMASRVLVCGGPHTGRTSFVRTLAAYAVKSGRLATVVNTDPRDGMLTLPGTLSAALFSTIMDIENEGSAGWGDAPASGPSAVPNKIPTVLNYGYAKPADAPVLYQEAVTRLAGTVSQHLNTAMTARVGGVLIDTPALGSGGSSDSDGLMTLDQLSHIVDEFSVNRIVVLGGDKQLRDLVKARFQYQRTTLDEQIEVVGLESSDGVVARSELMLQHLHEANIKEYFFGDARRTLSPHTMLLDSDTLTVFRCPEAGSNPRHVQKVEANGSLAHWTLAVMNAGVHDSPETVQNASVLGFVYVSEVDTERRKIRILSPISYRLAENPLILDRWPEPFINLVG